MMLWKSATVAVLSMLCFGAGTHVEAGLDVWTPIPYPLETTDYLLDVVATTNHVYVLVYELDRTMRIFRRSHDGGEWMEVPVQGNPIAISVAGENDEHIVASTREKQFWYSDDGGASWTNRTAGLPPNGVLNCVLVHESGWTYTTVWKAAGDTHGVARSSDFGVTWDFVPRCTGCVMNPFLQLETSGDPRLLWTGGIDGWFLTDLRRSTDWGASWEPLSLPPLYGHTSIDIVIDPVFSERSYMLAPEPFLRFEGTEDVGYTFPPFGTDANMNLAAPSWDPTVIYASGQWSSGLVAIARSPDFGYAEWETIREGIPQEYPPHPASNYWKNHLEPHPTEPRMYLEVWGMGLFERDFTLDPSDVPDAGPAGPSPLTLLGPVVPNPTEGQIDLSAQVAEAGYLRLELVDVQGRRFYDGGRVWREPGSHEIGLELSGVLAALPMGTYFIRVTDDLGVASRRVAIVR